MNNLNVDIVVASAEHVSGIHKLLDKYKFLENGDGFVIPLSENEISSIIESGDFFVTIINGEVKACSSVVTYPETPEYKSIAELRSLVVEYEYQRNGIGSDLIKSSVGKAFEKGYDKIYVFTKPYLRPLFERNGFEYTPFPPQKLSKDCFRCPQHYAKNCTEDSFVHHLI